MKNSKNLLPHYLNIPSSRLIDYVYTHTHMLQNTCFVQFLRFNYIFSSMYYCTTHMYTCTTCTQVKVLQREQVLAFFCKINYNYREYPYLYKALCFTFTGNIYMPTCVRFLLQSWSTLHPFHCLWSILPPMLVVLWNFYPHDPTQRIDPSPLILSMYTIYLRRPLLR